MPNLNGTTISGDPNDKGLQGNLSVTTISDLLQFLATSSEIGALRIVREPEDEEGLIFFGKGKVLSARTEQQTGLESFAEMLNWKQGSFNFLPGLTPLEATIDLSVQHAILEAIVLQENQSDASISGSASSGKAPFGSASPSSKKQDNAPTTSKPEIEKGSTDMEQQQLRESTDILNNLLEISGIDAVVVVGRDGFVIESVGSSARINIDELGASLAHSINGIEEMGSELNINRFQDMFVEYGNAVIMCKPVGDAIAALVTPDASKLGIIRHKTKKLFQELGLSF